MLPPKADTPLLPEFVDDHTRVRNTLMAVIPETDAADGIHWAQGLIDEGNAEEYALGATTLEDVYIRLTGDVEAHNGAAA